MPTRDKTSGGWGSRFRQLARAKGLSLAKVAEAYNVAESTVRSWTNGTREINLTDFLGLCSAAGIDPAQAMFGRIGLSPEQKENVLKLTASLLDSEPSPAPRPSKDHRREKRTR